MEGSEVQAGAGLGSVPAESCVLPHRGAQGTDFVHFPPLPAVPQELHQHMGETGPRAEGEDTSREDPRTHSPCRCPTALDTQGGDRAGGQSTQKPPRCPQRQGQAGKAFPAPRHLTQLRETLC